MVALDGHPAASEGWLRGHDEECLEPELPIVDAHHHLFDFPQRRYLADCYREDLRTVPGVRATVAVECGTQYSRGATFPALGETEWIAEQAEGASLRGARVQIAAGIIACADVTRPERLVDAIEAHRLAAHGRLRGIRYVLASDDDPDVVVPHTAPSRTTLTSTAVSASLHTLADQRLPFDVWCYHPQLLAVAEVARAHPSTTFVVDHIGGPLAVGRYRATPMAVEALWREGLSALASLPNVLMKIGGMAMAIAGDRWRRRPSPPTSQELASAWHDRFHSVVAAFGPQRCMLESNFPMDKISLSYVNFWNTCMRLTANMAPDARRAIFHDTAAATYCLPTLPAAPAVAGQ